MKFLQGMFYLLGSAFFVIAGVWYLFGSFGY